MTRPSTTVILALSVAALFAALSVVAWRQGGAREVMTEREDVRESIALETEERSTLLDEIRHLESRRRVVTDARDRLGLRIPDASDVVLFPVDER